MIRLATRHIRLTTNQKSFILNMIDENFDAGENRWIQVLDHELRTAKSLERHGIIELDSSVFKGITAYEARLIVAGEFGDDRRDIEYWLPTSVFPKNESELT